MQFSDRQQIECCFVGWNLFEGIGHEWTNFLILRCVMMEKGPMYGNLKYKQLSLRALTLIIIIIIIIMIKYLYSASIL